MAKAGTITKTSIPDLVAHRGDMTRCPENSLAAIRRAVDAGARFVEFDIQLSADKIPMLQHDGTLERTSEGRGAVWNHTAEALNQFGKRMPSATEVFSPRSNIATLAQCVELLNATPHVTAFVELKPESMAHFGMPVVVENAYAALSTAAFPWVFISFEYESLVYARTLGNREIGWVLPKHSPTTRERAQALQPEYIFCNNNKLPPGSEGFWPGPWRWGIYVIDDAEQALATCARGAQLIETNRISDMLQTSPFNSAA